MNDISLINDFCKLPKAKVLLDKNNLFKLCLLLAETLPLSYYNYLEDLMNYIESYYNKDLLDLGIIRYAIDCSHYSYEFYNNKNEFIGSINYNNPYAEYKRKDNSDIKHSVFILPCSDKSVSYYNVLNHDKEEHCDEDSYIKLINSVNKPTIAKMRVVETLG